MLRILTILLTVFALAPASLRSAENPYLRHFGPSGSLELKISDTLNEAQHQWPATLLDYPIRFEGIDLRPEQLGLFDADDKAVPHQWSGLQLEGGVLRFGHLHFITDLPRGGARRFVLRTVEPKQRPARRLFGWQEPGGLAVDTGRLQALVPGAADAPPEGAPIPGPIGGLALGGDWLGASVINSPKHKVVRMETNHPERGPLLKSFERRYEFEGGGSYTARLTAIAGQPFLQFSETIEKLPESEGVELSISFDGYGAEVVAGQRIGPFVHTGSAPCQPHLQFDCPGAPSLAIFARDLHRWRDGIYSLHPGGDSLAIAVSGNKEGVLTTRWKICSADDGSANTRHTAIALFDRSRALAKMAVHPPGRAAGASSDFSGWLYYYQNALSLDRYKDWVLQPRGEIRELSENQGWISGDIDARRATALLFDAYRRSGDELGPATRSGLTGQPKAALTRWLELADIAYRMPEHPMAGEWMDQAQRALALGAELYKRPDVKEWNAQGGRPAWPAADGSQDLNFAGALARIQKLREGDLDPPAMASFAYAPGIGKHTGYGAVLADGSAPGGTDLRLLQLDRGANYGWARRDAEAGGGIGFSVGGNLLSSADPFGENACQLQAWNRGRYRSLGAGPLDHPFVDLSGIRLASIGSLDGKRSRSVLLSGEEYFLVDDRFDAPLSRWSWSSTGELPYIYFAGTTGEFLSREIDGGKQVIHQQSHPRGSPSTSLAIVTADGALKVGGHAGMRGLNARAGESGPIEIEGPFGRDLVFWSPDGERIKETGEGWQFDGTRGRLRHRADGQVELALFDARPEPKSAVRIGSGALALEIMGEAMAVSARHENKDPDPEDPAAAVVPVSGHYAASKPGVLRLQFGPESDRGYQQTGKLIAYWKFNGGEGANAADLKAPGRPAQLVGQDPSTARTEGVGFSVDDSGKQALQLDGSGHMETFFADALPAEFSLSFWTKSAAAGVLFSKTVLRDGEPAKGSLSAHIGDDGLVHAQIAGAELVSETKVSDDAWHHLTFTVEDKRLTLYVDGKPETGSAFPSARRPAPLRFGAPAGGKAREPGTGGGRLIGAIDNFRIYDFALRQQEIEAIYLVGAKKAPIVITSEPMKSIRVGETFNYSLNYTGAPFVQFRFVGLPGWLDFEGRITGSPTAKDVGLSKMIRIAGVCPWGPVQQSFQIIVLPPLVERPWRLYVDGRAVPVRYVGRGIEATLPAGSGRWEFTRGKPAPNASSIVSVLPSPAGLAVNARAAGGATNYRIESSSDGGASWAPLGEGGRSPRQLIPALPAGDHLLRVIASNGERDSEPSAPFAYAMPGEGQVQTPAAPRLEIIDAGVRLRWDAVPGASSYKLYRRPAGESEWKQIQSSAGLMYIDRGAKGVTPPYPLPGYQSNVDKSSSALTVFEYSLGAMSGDKEGERSPIATTDPRSWLNWSPLPADPGADARRRAALWQPPIKPADQAPPRSYPK